MIYLTPETPFLLSEFLGWLTCTPVAVLCTYFYMRGRARDEIHKTLAETNQVFFRYEEVIKRMQDEINDLKS